MCYLEKDTENKVGVSPLGAKFGFVARKKLQTTLGLKVTQKLLAAFAAARSISLLPSSSSFPLPPLTLL
jgi:hypothetical protein